MSSKLRGAKIAGSANTSPFEFKKIQTLLENCRFPTRSIKILHFRENDVITTDTSSREHGLRLWHLPYCSQVPLHTNQIQLLLSLIA